MTFNEAAAASALESLRARPIRNGQIESFTINTYKPTTPKASTTPPTGALRTSWTERRFGRNMKSSTCTDIRTTALEDGSGTVVTFRHGGDGYTVLLMNNPVYCEVMRGANPTVKRSAYVYKTHFRIPGGKSDVEEYTIRPIDTFPPITITQTGEATIVRV